MRHRKCNWSSGWAAQCSVLFSFKEPRRQLSAGIDGCNAPHLTELSAGSLPVVFP